LANDTDPENNISPSSVTITQQALNGTAVANANGTITYTPNTGFFGADNFNYQVCDGDSPITCDQANVTLVINQTSGIEEGLMHSVIAYSDGLIIKNISGKLIIYNLDGSISKIIDSSAAENLKFKTGIYFIYSNQLNSSFKILVP